MNYKEVIESKYNRQNWQKLLHDIFGSKVKFWSTPSIVTTSSQFAKQALWLGTITLSDEQTISIYEVELSDSVDIERNRRGIRDMLLTSWRNNGNAGAFMFCYCKNESVLRFSYVSESWKFAEDGSYQKETTDTRRFTYLLGEGHRSRTAIQQFEKLRDSGLSLKDLTKAFSVDAVSDMFFAGYKKQYEDIIFYITGKRMVKVANKWEERLEGEPCGFIMHQFSRFTNPEKAVRDYVKKLMGRIVFLQFLQKKGWLGVDINDKWGSGDSEYIQKLYDDCKDKDHFVDKVLEPLFNDLNTQRNNDLASFAKYKVPYLNGGLFEREAADETDFPLPAKYMQSLLDFFASYNFTIDENDPDDAEVGVDPEMLGRIFENLLEDNKDKGAFYTPKEIVSYMCRESLIAYLQTGIEDECAKEAIRQFVTTHQIQEHLPKSTNQLLKDVKICDPAIGSGAFPMGLLKELFLCRMALEGFDQSKAADIKKHIIQQNIYGVDIERGAVDIARLRFWLSLIVDEENPQALPNLDFKIMQGNSLLEQYCGVDLSNILESNDMFVQAAAMELPEKLKQYYMPKSHEEKMILKKEITDIVKNCIREANAKAPDIQVDGNDQFFLWHTWFADVFNRPSKQGFDIVIGNPPYLFLSGKGSPIQRLRGAGRLNEANALERFFDLCAQAYPSVSKGCRDYYKWFYKLALKICRIGGIVSYITPDTYFNMPKYLDLRKELLSNTVRLLVDLGFSVFDAPTVSSSIIVLIKNAISSENVVFADIKFCLNKENRRDLVDIIHNNLVDVAITEYNICAYKNNLAEMLYNSPSTISIDHYLSFTEGEHNIQMDNISRIDGNGFVPVLIDSEMRKNSFVYKGFVRSNLSYSQLHSGERCLLRKTGDAIIAAIPETTDFAIAHQNVYVVKAKNRSFSMKFWLGILNSKLLTFLYQNGLYGQKGRTLAQFRIYALNVLPIPITVEKFNQSSITKLVDKILTIKKSDFTTDTLALEYKIDHLVYQLYNLTEEEIKIIENE